MRLIDADAMQVEWLAKGLDDRTYDTNDVLDSIDEQPTIDPEYKRPPQPISLVNRYKLNISKITTARSP